MLAGELLVKIGTDLTEYRKGLAEAQKQAQGFASTIKETLKNAAGVALGMAGFQGITQTIKNTIGAGINLNAQLEQNRIAFQVLTGSAAQAKKIVQDLYQYSASTPFEFPGVVEAGRALQTVGLNVKETIKWVGDLAAANPQATIEEVARAIARLKSGDFGEAFERLRDFGISRQMLEGEGLVFDKSGSYKGSVEEALAAVQRIVEKRYGGMAEAQSRTFTGMLSTLKDNLNMVFGTALEPVFNRIKQALPGILEELNKFSETFRTKGAAAAFKEIIPPGVVDAVAAAGKVIKDLFEFIKANGDLVKGILVGVAAGFAALKVIETAKAAITGFQAAVSGLTMLTNPVGLVVAAIGLLAFAAYEIYKHWDGIKKFFSDLWKGIKDTVSSAVNAVLGFLRQHWPLILAIITGPIGMAVYAIAKHWNEIKAGIATAWAAIKGVAANAVTAVVNTIKNIFARVKDIAKDALAWGRNIVEGLWQGIKNAVGWLKNMITGWVRDVKTFLKKLFKISSPSGVTREIGQQVAAGLAVGITDGTPQVLSALDAQIAAAEAKLKEATARLNAIQEQQAKTQQENERKNLEQEVANADARVKLTEGDIALLRKKLEEYQKHGKDVSSVLQQIAEAEQRLTQDKQKAAEARSRLAEFEAKAQVEATQKTVNALKEQKQVLEDYKSAIRDAQDVIEKYYADLDAAREEYEKKVAETNAKLAEDERKLTEEYEKAVSDRAKALRDFVGLFDAVTTRNVSGQQLLENLRGQVKTFEEWSANIQALATRGIDEGLLQELREMGPKAAPEIAALNTLTDAELNEYVKLWREKNQLARQEAVIQLQQQRVEMEQKLIEIRIAAQQQLEQYRIEWEKKNAEIRKNTEEELKKIEQRFKDISEAGTKYGISLMTNFISGVESQFDRLRQILEEMAAMIDSYMPHSPAKRGPLSRIAEWGPALVQGLAEGIRRSLPSLEEVTARMAALSPGALAPAIATSYNTSNAYYGGNTIYIQVSGGNNASDLADQLMRELRKRGVRL